MVGSQCNGAFSGSTAAAFEAKNQVLPTVSHFFPDRRGPFLDRLVNRNWRSGAGMTKQLFEAFNEVGWTWTDAETMVHSSGLHLKWLQDSVTFVNNVLEKAWIRHVAAQIHWPNFDIESFDAQAFARCVKKRSPRQQGILMTLACGKHVTMDALVHYSQRVESKQCPFCTEEDSKNIGCSTALSLPICANSMHM